MSNWWDFGLKGRDSSYLLKSGGVALVSPSLYNMSGAMQVGSIAFNTSPSASGENSSLLLTTSGGTQIYVVATYRLDSGSVHLPDETVNYWNGGLHIRIKRGDAVQEMSTAYSGGFSRYLAGEGSIYNFNRRYTNGNFGSAYQFPRAGASGGTTNQIAMVTANDGISFYVIGYYDPNNPSVTCPAVYIGKISDTWLNNKNWFDPNADAVTEGEYMQFIGSSITPVGVDYNYPGDDIDFPDLPTGASAVGFGRMKIFHPTSAQLASALDILWSDATETTLETIIESCKKWWYKPEQYCTSLMLMPLDVSGTNSRIYFGKYDTEVDAPAISGQWQIVDCGSLNIPLRSESAFDYAPHVKAMIFLPYIGFRPIDVNEIMGGTASIKYYVDMFTGAAVCFVKVSNSNSNSSVLYTYECNVASQIPLTSENYNQVINSVISTSLSLAMQNYGAAAANWAAVGAGAGSPILQTSGKYNANAGALGHNKPYIVLHFPITATPAGFVNQNGYPSSVNTVLSNLAGYTEVEKIHLNIPGAYEEDLSEIERLLSDGVIL